jgi:hypothetical protein
MKERDWLVSGWLGVWRLLVLAGMVALGAVLPVLAEEEVPADDAAPAAEATDDSVKPKLSEAQTLAGMFGKSTQSDYVAKNFSLLFGFVVANPFDFEKIMPPKSASGSGDASEAQTAMPAGERYTLKSGSPEASAFVEAGVRYRWAWLDRKGIGSVDAGSAIAAANLDDQARRLEQEVGQAQLRLNSVDLAQKAAQVKLQATSGDPATLRDIQQLTHHKAEAQAALVLAESKVAALQQKALAAARATARQQWLAAQDGTLIDAICLRWEQSQDGKWVPRCDLRNCFRSGDASVRMGYVFDGGSASGISSIVSNSNFYGDLVGGINVVRFALPTSLPEEPPIRGTFNLEAALNMATDSSINDVHTRYLFGLGYVMGVPLFSPPTATAASETDPSKSAPETTAPIVEMVARFGAVNVEAPRFIDDVTREVKVENEAPHFQGRWGFGMDLELNVPIAERAGYIMARGSLNAGFDPNPWGFQIGYTIPLSTLASVVRGVK